MKQRSKIMYSGDDLSEYNMHQFGKDISDDESDIQLHKITPPEHFIEAQVLEGDTVQAISLRFHCSISELKRINHIHKDNEIYARRTIKVPVTPYSILTEVLPSTVPIHSVPSTSRQAPATNGLRPKEGVEYEIDYNAAILNSHIAPAIVPYTDVDETAELAAEDTQLLQPKKDRVSVEALVVKELTSNGADFGLKWYHLLICALIIGLVVPFWIYFKVHLDTPPHEILEHAPLKEPHS